MLLFCGFLKDKFLFRSIKHSNKSMLLVSGFAILMAWVVVMFLDNPMSFF